ncbi:hypothetical protein [Deinococcus pimensis]|uniref:hypothetical protein n=1 Tax=Deinococcus pimensis TaxID=309888 RepID=UPI00047FB119|nr:hypothetical protein [Deinococcus pimensis]
MTTAQTDGTRVPRDVEVLVEATRELREARELLRSGNVVRGVQRYEHAKRALYRTVRDLPVTPDAPPESALMRAGREFHQAYETSRTDTSDARAALGLARAEKILFGELEALERTLN